MHEFGHSVATFSGIQRHSVGQGGVRSNSEVTEEELRRRDGETDIVGRLRLLCENCHNVS